VLDSPRRRRRPGPGIAAAAAALLFASVGWWFTTDKVAQPAGAVAVLPARVLQGAAAAPEPKPEAEAITAAAAPQAAPSVRTACAEGECAPPLPAAQPAAAEAPAGPADPDAWALHPEPGPVNPAGGFSGRVNTPEVPDEFDPTPGEDSPVEEAAAVPPASE
jgi:hypothetical protein